jgi:hypothetical protein
LGIFCGLFVAGKRRFFAGLDEYGAKNRDEYLIISSGFNVKTDCTKSPNKFFNSG